jgi:hypothetical protein
MSHRSSMRCDGLVTEETCVVISHCVAAACISIAVYIRYHGYEVHSRLLRSSVYNRLPIRCLYSNSGTYSLPRIYRFAVA